MQSNVLTAQNLIQTYSEGLGLNSQLKSTIFTLQSLLQATRSAARVYTTNSLKRLLESSDSKKTQVLNHLRDQIQIMELSQIPSIPTSDTDHPEAPLVRQALDFYGLKVEKEFWKTLKKDQIVEIYNEDNIQVFRTFNLFNTCGYSLSELLTNEWYVLWERPSFVLQLLMKYSSDVLSGAYSGTTKMHIGSHIVKEVYNEENANQFKARTALVDFEYLAPLYKSNGEIGGFIISSTAVLGGEVDNEEVNKVRML